jgi:hypothetical protein
MERRDIVSAVVVPDSKRGRSKKSVIVEKGEDKSLSLSFDVRTSTVSPGIRIHGDRESDTVCRHAS